jgi:transposase
LRILWASASKKTGKTMSPSESLCSPVDPAGFAYVVGIDVGSEKVVYTICHPDKRPLGNPTTVGNDWAGFGQLDHALAALGVEPAHILMRLEATSRYNETPYQFLAGKGYTLCLLHPRQMHHFAQQRGLRAKTDRLDAVTIARVLLSGEARVGYVPDELIATYRELERLHSQLTAESARYQNEIHALLVVLFPELTQVFADPCGATAWQCSSAIRAWWPSPVPGWRR